MTFLLICSFNVTMNLVLFDWILCFPFFPLLERVGITINNHECAQKFSYKKIPYNFVSFY
jgi:hypothetical protein